MRKAPGAIHIETAVKSICTLCEEILCRRIIKEVEARVSDRLFILESVMYALGVKYGFSFAGISMCNCMHFVEVIND